MLTNKYRGICILQAIGRENGSFLSNMVRIWYANDIIYNDEGENC